MYEFYDFSNCMYFNELYAYFVYYLPYELSEFYHLYEFYVI